MANGGIVKGLLSRITWRRAFWGLAALLWGAAVTLALEAGWAHAIPDPAIGILFVAAAFLLVGLAWTDDRVKKYRYLIYTYPVISLIVLIFAGAIFGASVGAFGWWTIHRKPSQKQETQVNQTAPVLAQPEGPTFREKVEKVSFSLGENGTVTTWPMKWLENQPFRFVNCEAGNVVQMYARDGKLYADVTMYEDDGTPHQILKGNDFTINNRSLDRNFNNQAFEIVDRDGNPIFQFIKKTEAHIIIKGVFEIPRGLVLVNDKQAKQIEGHEIPADFKLSRIFKYPSYKYLGQVE